jgi:hypothetical protein
MKKVFLRTYFGGQFPPWMDKYIDNCNGLKDYEWFIFTDAPCKSRGNVTMWPMDTTQFCDLVSETTGVRPDFSHIKDWRKANDFRPALGLIFAKYIPLFDFWGHTDFDCVYGDLDKYLTDQFLSTLDIFSNDPFPSLCGPFTLYRNCEVVNNLFREHPAWEQVFGESREHGFEEEGHACENGHSMCDVMRTTGLRVQYRFWQSRQWLSDSTRVPAKLENGRLTYRGEETMMIHFNRTKAWPC